MKVIDLHCDTLSEMIKQKELLIDTNLKENRHSVDIKKMLTGDYLLQVFAVYTDMKKGHNLESALQMIDLFYQEIEKYKKYIDVVLEYKDILENSEKNKLSAMLSIEDADCCRGNISILRNFYRLGVRMMSLTWNYENELGYPNEIINGTLVTTKGLKNKGYEFVEEMENLGIIIDASHLSDEGFYGILDSTSKPFVASHSNARAICKNGRNLSDDMIRELAQRGGVMGINFYPHFLNDRTGNFSRIDYMIEHINHIVKIGGINCVSLGSDFDGIGSSKVEIEDASKMQLLADALEKEGYSYDDMEKIFYKNALNLFKQII